MHIPALRSADHRDAPLSSTKDGDQRACPLPTLAGSRTSDGWRESDISYVRLLFRKMSSSRPRESGPGRIRDRTIRPHVIDILVSSSRISDLRARRYGALSSPAAPRRAACAHGPHVRTHSRPLLYTRGGSSRRVTTMWVTVRFRPFILPLICCHLFDDTPQCAPPPRDSI